MRVIGYVRVSTREQADSGLGLAAQRAAITAEAERRGWDVTWCEDDGYTGKNANRPALQRALDLLRRGEAEVLVVAKLDRLSRSLLDFAELMHRSTQEGWSFVALDVGVDTTTPGGELMVNVMASFAHYEARIIGVRTADALAEARARGVRLGRPPEIPEPVAAKIVALAARGHSRRRIADMLTKDGTPTPRGGQRWYGSTVGDVLDRAARQEVA